MVSMIEANALRNSEWKVSGSTSTKRNMANVEDELECRFVEVAQISPLRPSSIYVVDL
jgi:hypothetical protein